MDLHVVAGCVYLALNTLLPWAVLAALARRAGDARWLWPAAAVIAPLVSFVFGGLWFAVAGWLTAAPTLPAEAGYGSVGGFVLAGVFSVFFFVPGSLVVLLAAAVWRRLAPASFARLTRRGA